MFFGIIILIRILFAACMVFIIGYIFGNFSKKPTLAAISKVASILAIVLFISANIFFFRFNGWHHRNNGWKGSCEYYQKDSVIHK
ncbi:MAG TPA: hypothetical protein VLI68_17560 [Hanamia sp.]|nr:hypothetical protein [Hanamia sp.]